MVFSRKAVEAMDAAIAAKDARLACDTAAKLAAASNTTAQTVSGLLAYLVQVYCHTFMTRNAWVSETLLNDLSAIDELPRKYMATRPMFQKALCEILAMFCTLRPVTHEFCDTEPVYTVATVEQHIHAAGADNAIKHFQGMLTDEVRCLIGVLWHHVKRHNAPAVQAMLDYLLFSQDVQDCCVQAIIWPDIGHIRQALRSDVVWYLWRMLLLNVKCDQTRTWCKQHLGLYAYNFQRQYRDTRVCLLYYCYGAITNKKKAEYRPKELTLIENYQELFPRPPPQQRSAAKKINANPDSPHTSSFVGEEEGSDACNSLRPGGGDMQAPINTNHNNSNDNDCDDSSKHNDCKGSNRNPRKPKPAELEATLDYLKCLTYAPPRV